MDNTKWKSFFEILAPIQLGNTQAVLDQFFKYLEEDPKQAADYMFKITIANNINPIGFWMGALYLLAMAQCDEKYLQELIPIIEYAKKTLKGDDGALH